jgi:hypothetical protein
VRPIGKTARLTRDKKGCIRSTCILFDDGVKIVLEDILSVMGYDEENDYQSGDDPETVH